MLNTHEVPPQPGGDIGSVGAVVERALTHSTVEHLQTAYADLALARDAVAALAHGSVNSGVVEAYAHLEHALTHVDSAEVATATAHSQLSSYLAGLKLVSYITEHQLLRGDEVAATPEARVAGMPADAESLRTELSRVLARDARQGNMERFANLSIVDQEHLRDETQRVLATDDIAEAFDYFLLTHDIGKNERVRRALGAGPDVDHDMLYTMLVCDPSHLQARRELMPGFDKLSPEGQRLIIKAAELNLNYPQTLQGEAPAATLQAVQEITDPLVLDFDILKSKFDIFGAAGHLNQTISITATSTGYRRMKNLDAALRDPDLHSAEDRNNAFLDAEIRDLAGGITYPGTLGPSVLRAVARLECHLRVENPQAFTELLIAYMGQPPVVKEILTTELGRSGQYRATLPYYGPVLFRTLNQQLGPDEALTYYAHILQEAHIADGVARRQGSSGLVTADFAELTRSIATRELDPHESPIRFRREGEMLIPETVQPHLTDLEGIPSFDGEPLRGKRVLVVGMGGGSDIVQADMLNKLLGDKFGAIPVGVVSSRNPERVVTNTGARFGSATSEITADTRPVGDWRFLENIPLEGPEPTRSFILNSSDPATIAADLKALQAATGAEVIIGVDTGGDSLYTTEHAGFSAHLPTDITPDHDYLTLLGLNKLAGSGDTQVLTAIVAPGVDAPPYAREMLTQVNATQIDLTPTDRDRIATSYAGWRMNGSGSEEGRYGKTPLAWLHALAGRFGLQVLHLPRRNVVDVQNPWRAFTYITPAMSGIVMMDAQTHLRATQRKES